MMFVRGDGVILVRWKVGITHARSRYLRPRCETSAPNIVPFFIFSFFSFLSLSLSLSLYHYGFVRVQSRYQGWTVHPRDRGCCSTRL